MLLWMRIAVAVVIVILAAIISDPIIFPGWEAVIKQVRVSVARLEFWVDNALVFIIYGLFIGFASSTFQDFFRKRVENQYKGWVIRVVKAKECGTEDILGPDEPLFWQDVERYKHSEAEFWKAVKPIVRDITGDNVAKRLQDALNDKCSIPGISIPRNSGRKAPLR